MSALHLSASPSVNPVPSEGPPRGDCVSAPGNPWDFAHRPVAAAELRSILEAAHPSPQADEDRPWRFLIAHRDDQESFGRLQSCIDPANHGWTLHAPVLVLSFAKLSLPEADGVSHSAIHELGGACASIAMAARSRGFTVHQFFGVRRERVRALYRSPENFTAWTCMALGYHEGAGMALAPLAPPECASRTHGVAAQFTFSGTWGQPLSRQDRG